MFPNEDFSDLISRSQVFTATEADELVDLSTLNEILKRFFDALNVVDMVLSAEEFEILIRVLVQRLVAHLACGSFSCRYLGCNLKGDVRNLSFQFGCNLNHAFPSWSLILIP